MLEMSLGSPDLRDGSSSLQDAKFRGCPPQESLRSGQSAWRNKLGTAETGLMAFDTLDGAWRSPLVGKEMAWLS
jgi:hypothetical protein